CASSSQLKPFAADERTSRFACRPGSLKGLAHHIASAVTRHIKTPAPAVTRRIKTPAPAVTRRIKTPAPAPLRLLVANSSGNCFAVAVRRRLAVCRF
ncbi:hypothetical protein, partial [Indiicoccus explosivorum]|uniref:hypothetical protein n=1 Tax=Indiicoccus explosivorum TaxID=1917864 RepID=UPI0019D32128